MRQLPFLIPLLTLLSKAGLAFPQAYPPEPITALIHQAGSAQEDLSRLEFLRQIAEIEGLSPSHQNDLAVLTKEVDRWINDTDLRYFSRQIRQTGKYDFGLSEDSPFSAITDLLYARMLVWVALEYGEIWQIPERRLAFLAKARILFERLQISYPENRLVGMYLGTPISDAPSSPKPKGAPEWAVSQRQALERLTRIIHWWIDNRMRNSGEYGGGWGDDCEMWRWWMPVLIAFEDPKVVEAQQRFSRALLAQHHLSEGYTDRISDVEHTAEDTADSITPMMFLEPNHSEWNSRANRLAQLMRSRWTGRNDRGFLQFKSTYFTASALDLEPRKACDTVYHPRAVQPVLLLWQRTQDSDLAQLFGDWLDTWVDATKRAERGKPAGVIPSAIHWPDGKVGGIGEDWWKPGNYSDNPLYVWPGSMSMMTNTLLLAHYMTGEERYLAPIRSMAKIRLGYLQRPRSEEPSPGSVGWCGSKMKGLTDALSKYRLLTGSTEFDSLIEHDSKAYTRFRVYGDRASLTEALRSTARELSRNFPAYTQEVRFTDRVLRFPQLFALPAMFPEAVEGYVAPDTELLFSCLTGEPGDGLYFPINAVRWLTRPKDIAALVTKAGKRQFEAELFHFGEHKRRMGAEFFLLERGLYKFRLTDLASGEVTSTNELHVRGPSVRTSFELQANLHYKLVIEPVE